MMVCCVYCFVVDPIKPMHLLNRQQKNIVHSLIGTNDQRLDLALDIVGPKKKLIIERDIRSMISVILGTLKWIS